MARAPKFAPTYWTTNPNKINTKLIDEIIKTITAKPRRHDQGVWGEVRLPKPQSFRKRWAKRFFAKEPTLDITDAWTLEAFFEQNPRLMREVVSEIGMTCPSSACVAGWAVLLDGKVFAPTPMEVANALTGDSENMVTVENCRPARGGTVTPIADTARRIMGLDSDDSSWLFGGSIGHAAIVNALRSLKERGEQKITDIDGPGMDYARRASSTLY